MVCLHVLFLAKEMSDLLSSSRVAVVPVDYNTVLQQNNCACWCVGGDHKIDIATVLYLVCIFVSSLSLFTPLLFYF